MLGSFSSESLEEYARVIAEKSPTVDYSETDTYDFTRCVRPDGSAYGTGGRCVKGSQEDKKAADKPSRTPRQSKTDRVTREVARTGGQIPGVAKPQTAEEKTANQERIKKIREAEAKKGEEKAKVDATVKSMAQKMAEMSGERLEGQRMENHVNNFVNDINRLRANSRDTELQDMIRRGDTDGIIRKAREKGDSKENVAKAAEQEKEKQKARLKAELAAAPKEQHARIRELARYDAKQAIAREKDRAEKVNTGLFGIAFALKNAQ
jgi:hypothetical protein